jgi:multidrug efflux pump subunit AcrA (membrane-fusion protein)
MTDAEINRILAAKRQRAYRRANLAKMRAQARARYAAKVGRPIRQGNYGRNASLG